MSQSPKLPWSGVPYAALEVGGSPVAPPDAPPSTLPAHTPEMAERLRLKAGVQNFTNADTRVYGHHAEAFERIVGMGMGYMRGMLLGNDGDNEFADFCRDNGVGWLMTTTPEAGITNSALQAKIRHLAENNADVCIGVEGMNEPNQERSGAPVADTWPVTTTASLAVLYNAMKSYPATAGIPICLPSLHDTQSANSYVAQRNLTWTRQTTDLAYSNGRWTATTPVAGATLATSEYVSPSAAGTWAATPFGGYTDIRGTGGRLVLEAWSATARLGNLGSLTLDGANNATVRDFPIVTTPAGTTRVRVRVEAVGGADAVLLLGGTTTLTGAQTNTYTLGLAPKPDGGFRQFHQLAAAGAGQYVDYAGMHRYTGGSPISTNWEDRSGNLLDAFPGLELWLTEIGWQDAMDLPLSSGMRPTPSDVGGIYAGRAVVFACGMHDTAASYFEELDDPDLAGTSVQAHFGLYNVGVGVATTPESTYDQRVVDANPDTSWTPKEGATEYTRILGWLADDGHEADPPGTVNYEMAVGTATLIHSHLVRFSSAHPTRPGEAWLMFYRDTKLYDAKTRTKLADAPRNFTLTDAQGSRTISATGTVSWERIRT